MVEIEGAKVYFPSIEDIAYNKYAAWREKDRDFVDKLWERKLIRQDKIIHLLECEPNSKLSNDEIEAIQERICLDLWKYCELTDCQKEKLNAFCGGGGPKP